MSIPRPFLNLAPDLNSLKSLLALWNHTRGRRPILLLRIFIQLTSSFPFLAEIIPRPRPPMRHQANLMFGRNNYHAFHRLIPMHTGKTGKLGLQKNRQSSVSAILRHVPHVQIYTGAIQMKSLNAKADNCHFVKIELILSLVITG